MVVRLTDLLPLEFGSNGFCRERKTAKAGEKSFGTRARTNNKLNPHRTPCLNLGHIGGK